MSEVDSSSLTVAVVGDISLGDHPVCIGHGMRAAFSKHGRKILGGIKSNLRDADVVIGNLETVASDQGLKKYSLPSYEMRGSPEHLRFVSEAGFDVLGFANNHAMHHGRAAFDETVKNIQNLGMSIIGVDDWQNNTQYKVITGQDGTQSAILAVSMRPEEHTKEKIPYSLRTSEEELIAEISQIREKVNGFLILSIHWGLEFMDLPSKDQVDLAHRLVDSGVDAIFGHHPHVLQPVEKYKGSVIFYSLGNFVFDLWPSETKKTIVAKVVFSEKAETSFSWVPITITNDFTLDVSSESDSKDIEALLDWSRFEKSYVKDMSPEMYRAQYSYARKVFRYSSYRYFLRNIIRYPMVYAFQSLLRTFLRRLNKREG